jgi:hypothetical protein
MSGAKVPYHMRQNKAVERQLFIDLLTRINRYRPISDYRYISFGGAYLEDFKLIHSHFGNRNLVSLENDSLAFARQKFNLPLSCIKALNIDSSAFIDEYNASNSSIIWLDFADPRRIREQILQFQALLPKLLHHDVLKITLNASPYALHSAQAGADGRRETSDVVNQKRLKKLEHRIGEFLPQNVSADQMSVDQLPSVLCKALEFAANDALGGRRADGIFFQPLTSFAYADSDHQMLTLTGIILNDIERKDFFRETQIRRWKLATPHWGSFQNIMVPALTAREKIFIDQLLPRQSSKAIHKKLKFEFENTPEKSQSVIDNYKKFYRYYPNFHKVII